MTNNLDGLSKPKYAPRAHWTQLRIRDYYRDYLRDLGALVPTTIDGEEKPRSMNAVLELLVTQAGANLVHQDMGISFTHTLDPYCPCGPEWPDEQDDE